MAQNLVQVLLQIRGGTALESTEQKIADIVEAVEATGKEGSITLKLTFKPDKNDETIVRVIPHIKASIPERAFTEGLFFIGANGQLTREDPRQIEMELERKAKLEQAGAVALTQVGRGS